MKPVRGNLSGRETRCRQVWRRTFQFTLLEMAAVFVVIGILAALSLRFISGANDQILPKETATLRSHLRFAQARAMAGTETSWSINIESDRYTLCQNGSPSSVFLPGDSSSVHNLDVPVQVTGGTGSVVFDSWGSPGTTDTVITLTDGERTETITITAMTGFIP